LLGDMRQKIGVLEGGLHAITLNRDTVTGELHDVRIQLADAIAKLTVTTAEAENWRRTAEECEEANKTLQKSGPSGAQAPAKKRGKASSQSE